MPRENSKCRKWEKERRDRLKEGFTNLAKVLPCYDPSINICKIDILQNAANSIHELQERIKHLLSSDGEKKTEKEEIIKKLQDRIKKLLVRNEQLSNLLRDAGITVPSVCGTIKKFKKQPLWSRRISPEQAELHKNEMEKENIVSVAQRKKEKTKRSLSERSSKDSSTVNEIGPKRRVRRNRKRRGFAVSNCYIVLSQTMPLKNNIAQQYYIITNQSNANVKNTIKSGINPRTAAKPGVPKGKHRPFRTMIYPSSLPSIGPGTLIFGNGVTVPVLPQSQSLLPSSSNAVLNSTFYTIPKIVQQPQNINQGDKNTTSTNIMSSSSANTKSLPLIKPKHCLTRTTQVNKVPIPALTSSYANNYCLLNELKIGPGSKKNFQKTKKALGQGSDLNKNVTKKANKRKLNVDEESNNKKSKTDLENEVTNCKTSESDIMPVNTSVDISISEKDTSKVSTGATNLEKNDALEKQVEKVVTEKEKMCIVNTDTEIIQPENDKTNKYDDMSNKNQETVTELNNENVQISINVTSTVATTTTVTASTSDEMKGLEINLPHSELSNDIFASLQVPSGCQNPESTSPTAAFLLAFPLVSSGVKVTEVIDGENSESQSVTPTLLQIGTMDTTKSTQSQSDVITSNFLNLDNFSFFSSKDICGNFDNNYSTNVSKPQTSTPMENNKSSATTTTSVHANVKSPLPTCVTEPVKQTCNVFCKKTMEPTKEMNRELKSCEKPNNTQKFTENDVYSSQILPNSKIDVNFSLPKTGNVAEKSLEQKPQYHVATTYPNSTCNFNYRTDLTKSCAAPTCSYTNTNRNYTNPLYTNCSNYNYNYHPETNFNQNYYKNIPRNEPKSYYPLNYDNYPDYRRNETTGFAGKYYDPSLYTKEKKNNNVAKVKATPDNKQPINWMTAPDNRLQSSECLLTPFSKSNFSQTYPFTSYVTSASTYFSTTTMDTTNMNCALEAKKSLDIPVVPLNSHQRLDIEEKQFSWSPTKLPHFLDPPHTFVSSTLPTLVGDLALGNTLPLTEQKTDYNKPVKETKDFRQNSKVNHYENQSNFLSVSQLVDHNKPESIPAKTSSRRNSGNRSKNNIQHKAKRVTKHDNNKDLLPHCGINNDSIHQSRSSNNNYNAFSTMDLFSEQKNKNVHKNSSSSYSAEALIGNQVPDETVNKRYPPTANKSLGTSSFLAENIISYFPPVDVPQENYMSQNQNYQTNNFTHNLSTSFQNNTYSSNSFIYTASTIASSYLGTNNFDPSPHDYLPDNFNLISNPSKDNKHYSGKNCSKQLNKEEKSNNNSVCSNAMKKAKKKPSNDANNTLFDFPFLPIPGSNNSPILPDDFHSHTNFLAPTTPFSCKNSLYPKQSNDISGVSLLPLPTVCRSSIQHPEISPSINAVGTSLTNFNLSTIFPEINKGPISEMYQDTRIKEPLHHKSYNSGVSQVPFNSEPKFNFSS